MMTFGWNNYPSMFQGPTAKDQTAQAVAALQSAGVDVPAAVQDIVQAQNSGTALQVSPASNCGSGSWFYVLMGAAVVAGLMHRNRSKEA